MASNEKKRFYVIKVISSNYNISDEYLCVPYSWVTKIHDNQLALVSYPRQEDPSDTGYRVQKVEKCKEGGDFLAEIKYETNSFEDAESWIASAANDPSNTAWHRSTQENTSKNYREPLPNTSNSDYYTNPTPGCSKDYFTEAHSTRKTTTGSMTGLQSQIMDVDYDSDESSHLVICEEATPSPKHQQQSGIYDNIQRNIASKSTAVPNRENNLSLSSIQISDASSARTTINCTATRSDVTDITSHNRASTSHSDLLTSHYKPSTSYNAPSSANKETSTSTDEPYSSREEASISQVFTGVLPKALPPKSHHCNKVQRATGTKNILQQGQQRLPTERNSTVGTSVPAPAGVREHTLPPVSSGLSTLRHQLLFTHNTYNRLAQQLQANEPQIPNDVRMRRNNEATTIRNMPNLATPSCSFNQSPGLHLPAGENRIPSQSSTATSSTTYRTAVQNPRLGIEQEILDIYSELFEGLEKSLFHAKHMYQTLRSKMIDTVEVYHNLTQSGELYNALLIEENNTSSTGNVPLKFPKISENILTELEPSEDSSDIDQLRSSKGYLRQYYLPPEHNPSDSRWTLKYRAKMPGLVELVPNSGIYVVYAELRYVTHVAKDCESLAQLLLPEVFHRIALGVCLTFTEMDQNGRDSTLVPLSVEPVLDQGGRQALLKFVTDHATEKGWNFDMQRIISAIDVKIKNYRFKFRVLPKFRRMPPHN